jgi:hypothetical protein
LTNVGNPVQTRRYTEEHIDVNEGSVQSTTRNWFLGHWRGETSLGVAYWRNNVLVANARVMIGIAVVFSAVRLHNNNTAPNLWLMAALAAGRDPMPKVWVNVIGDGTTVWLQGTMGEGSADEVRKTLETHPHVDTVMLTSRGGRAAEAEGIALLVRRKHLNTNVRVGCLSACTYVLVAGEHRSAEESAKIGFHRSSLPGLPSEREPHLIQQMVEYYRSAGLPPSFIDRVVAIKPENMWYPTRDELWEARVLNYTPKDEPSK